VGRTAHAIYEVISPDENIRLALREMEVRLGDDAIAAIEGGNTLGVRVTLSNANAGCESAATEQEP
jgi:hypothetical protein